MTSGKVEYGEYEYDDGNDGGFTLGVTRHCSPRVAATQFEPPEGGEVEQEYYSIDGDHCGYDDLPPAAKDIVDDDCNRINFRDITPSDSYSDY